MSADPIQPPLLDEVALEASSHSGLASAHTSTASGQASSRLNKNGSMSKMRSHRGNAPTLPQTKFCHLCPAKFTRTTHLNRHLKTHSNERLHECDRCHAQFTRSDLLTRHRRTCADSATNRSRRKSCQSCADSKVKCDLQRPCSKCKVRGRACVYVNDPGSNPEVDSSFQTSSSSPEVVVDSNPPATSNDDCTLDTDASPEISTEPAASSSTVVAPVDPLVDIASSSSLAPVDVVLNPSKSLPTYDTNSLTISSDDQSQEEKAYFTELFSSPMFDNLFTDLFTSSFNKNPIVPGRHFNLDSTAMLTDRFESTGIDQALIDAFFGPAQIALYTEPQTEPVYPTDPLANIPEAEMEEPTTVIHVEMPSVAEFYEYVMAFMTTYSWHMPIVHLPTFIQERRHITLVKATKAVGAMYSDTPAAKNWIEKVLSTVRDEIIAELSHTTDYETITQLTLASGMVQTIGMFHNDPDKRAKSNVYHGMIVMMLRMNGFVDKTRDWVPPPIDFSDPASVEAAWREWSRHESAKRALWLCYLHDCCHSIFFNLNPTFHTEQFTLGLPAEDGLWTAKNATEWAAILQTPSVYGSTEVRLRGHYLKALYHYLVSSNPGNEPRPFHVTPFAHFIMIHAMMRKIFEMYLRDRLPFSQPDGATPRLKVNPHFVDKDRVFHVQILLHYWLQSWLQSPETPRGVPESQQRFLFNALPFYWLAQVGLVAYQEGLPPFDPEGVYITSHEAKFTLMKKWERHVRKFLEAGEQVPTMFWDEVMKGRIDNWQATSGFDFTHLQGFFNPPPPRENLPA